MKPVIYITRIAVFFFLKVLGTKILPILTAFCRKILFYLSIMNQYLILLYYHWQSLGRVLLLFLAAFILFPEFPVCTIEETIMSLGTYLDIWVVRNSVEADHCLAVLARPSVQFAVCRPCWGTRGEGLSAYSAEATVVWYSWMLSGILQRYWKGRLPLEIGFEIISNWKKWIIKKCFIVMIFWRIVVLH